MYCRGVIKGNIKKHCFASTSLFPRVNYRSGAVNIGNILSQITLKKGACDFPDVGWIIFYTLLNFDIFNVYVTS